MLFRKLERKARSPIVFSGRVESELNELNEIKNKLKRARNVPKLEIDYFLFIYTHND